MKHLQTLFLTILLTLFSTSPVCALTYQKTDSLRVVELLTKGSRQAPSENLMVFYARQFIGIPYVGKTLEVNPKEELAVNLRELDCTTLVENVVALVLTTRQGSTRFADFCKNLTKIRYRDGKLNGYPSRNHYFSEWIDSNERQGLATEIKGKANDSRGAYYPFVDTQKLDITYMSTHPSSYPMLKDDAQALKQIKANGHQLFGDWRVIDRTGQQDR